MTQTDTLASGVPAPANEDVLYEVVNGQRVVPGEGLPWDDSLYEIVNGQRVEKSMGFYECGIASILCEYLGFFARSNRLGRVRVETMFRIDATKGLDRRPDVAFVSYQRWPKNRRRACAWCGLSIPI